MFDNNMANVQKAVFAYLESSGDVPLDMTVPIYANAVYDMPALCRDVRYICGYACESPEDLLKDRGDSDVFVVLLHKHIVGRDVLLDVTQCYGSGNKYGFLIRNLETIDPKYHTLLDVYVYIDLHINAKTYGEPGSLISRPSTAIEGEEDHVLHVGNGRFNLTGLFEDIHEVEGPVFPAFWEHDGRCEITNIPMHLVYDHTD